jgi:pimeloyl-ACP methyl ester carboxylesterase
VSELRVRDVSLQYFVLGSGPGLLVPVCNFRWLDTPFLEVLADRFTVVAASPRGFQGSTRLSASDGYSADVLATDLLAVCDGAGLDRFSVLGYSLTAAMAAWLARVSARIDAVVVGGFPLLGSYERVLLSAERDADALLADDDAAASIQSDFDVRAALSFYRELAALPDGALVTDVGCPMFAFWGTRDDILWSFNVELDFGEALTNRGIATHALVGGDHVSTILRFDEIAGHVIDWLGGQGQRSPEA